MLFVSLVLVVACLVGFPQPGYGAWHSELYPPSWTPNHPADEQGRFLHDFSYAGYRYGQRPLPSANRNKVLDVVESFGADPSGERDSTQAIQSAIDAASASAPVTVFLPKGIFRIDGTLSITRDRVILQGAGQDQTRLLFTSSDNLSYGSHLSLKGQIQREQDLFLAQDAQKRERTVVLKHASGLEVGDEVSVGWTITQDFVQEHGMQGFWSPFYDQWKPFFRRTVIAIKPTSSHVSVLLDVPLRYDVKVRHGASLRKERGYLKECGLQDFSVCNAVAWEDAWKQSQVHVIALETVKDCWIQRVRSVASPLSTGPIAQDSGKYHLQSSGILVKDSKRVTLLECQMGHAQHRGDGGNGYLFEIRTSNEILLRECSAFQGRHNFIQNWDFGTTGCVFLRCKSAQSQTVTRKGNSIFPWPAFCEYHHSLAMANLVDQCQLDDGWMAANRLSWSSGAGHTCTECVFWNTTGKGTLKSKQFGWGYVIGTGPDILVDVSTDDLLGQGTTPEDFVEGKGEADTLLPPSLYLDQLSRRLKANVQ